MPQNSTRQSVSSQSLSPLKIQTPDPLQFRGPPTCYCTVSCYWRAISASCLRLRAQHHGSRLGLWVLTCSGWRKPCPTQSANRAVLLSGSKLKRPEHFIWEHIVYRDLHLTNAQLSSEAWLWGGTTVGWRKTPLLPPSNTLT